MWSLKLIEFCFVLFFIILAKMMRGNAKRDLVSFKFYTLVVCAECVNWLKFCVVLVIFVVYELWGTY